MPRKLTEARQGMFQDLQWACVAVFTASIPLVVLAHYRYPESPVWHFIVLAAVLGWVLANAHAGIQHLWVDAERREELAAFDEAIVTRSLPCYNRTAAGPLVARASLIFCGRNIGLLLR